jgi:hypothetical protein
MRPREPRSGIDCTTSTATVEHRNNWTGGTKVQDLRPATQCPLTALESHVCLHVCLLVMPDVQHSSWMSHLSLTLAPLVMPPPSHSPSLPCPTIEHVPGSCAGRGTGP